MQFIRNTQVRKHIRKNKLQILYVKYLQNTIREFTEELDEVH